jgi:uncharacterized OsmC-like protein
MAESTKTEEIAAQCSWTPGEGYRASTPFGSVKMFEEGGQRAVELMMLSAAACLDFYLVEYAKARKLRLERIAVTCEKEMAKLPERVARIVTRVTLQGDIDPAAARKMVTMCEKACKVMNTLRMPPTCEVHTELLPSETAAPLSSDA